jgi:hypothetical protein
MRGINRVRADSDQTMGLFQVWRYTATLDIRFFSGVVNNFCG